MQKGFALGKCIKNILIAIVAFTPILCSLSCKAKLSFVMGDEIDIFDEVDKTHTTTITFYDENPAVNKSAKTIEKRYVIGEDVTANSLFPTDFRPGYRVSSWIYYDPDNAAAETPKNIHKEGDIIKSISVTLRPLCFYAERWILDSEVPYTVYHKLQNLDLTDYTDFETEVKHGLPETPIFGTDFKKEYYGFVFKEGTESVITEDGKAEVYNYYDRKIVTIKINSEAGTFADDLSATSVTLTGAYESKLQLPKLSKQYYNVVGFINDETKEEVETLETFPANDASYTVHWEEVGKVKYTVRHCLQKISVTQPTANEVGVVGGTETLVSGEKTYYKYYVVGYESVLYGFTGTMTTAQFATPELISNIENYAQATSESEIEQKVIADDGSTVVDVFYNVKPIEITLNPNGGNGTAIKQTFYTETDCITIQSSESLPFTMHNKHIASWNTVALPLAEPSSNASGTSYADAEAIPFTSVPVSPITLYAQWALNEVTGGITLPEKYTFVLKQGSGTADKVLQNGSLVLQGSNVTSGNTLVFVLRDSSGNEVSTGDAPTGTVFTLEFKQGGETVPGTHINGNTFTVPNWLCMPDVTYEIYMAANINGIVYDLTINGINVVGDE